MKSNNSRKKVEYGVKRLALQNEECLFSEKDDFLNNSYKVTVYKYEKGEFDLGD